MKKYLFGVALSAVFALASMNIASATDEPSFVNSESQVLSGCLKPLYTVTVDPSSITSTCIQGNGNLNTNLIAAFTVKSNTASSWVKLTAAKVLNKDVMDKVSNSVRLALVKTGATDSAITNAMQASPGANPNVIAYNVATEPADMAWNGSEKSLGKVVTGPVNVVKLKVLPTAIGGTYSFPDDMAGNYTATITCTAFDP